MADLKAVKAQVLENSKKIDEVSGDLNRVNTQLLAKIEELKNAGADVALVGELFDLVGAQGKSLDVLAAIVPPEIVIAPTPAPGPTPSE